MNDFLGDMKMSGFSTSFFLVVVVAFFLLVVSGEACAQSYLNERYEAGHWVDEKAHDYAISLSAKDSVYHFEWRRRDWDGGRINKGAEIKSGLMTGVKEQWVRFSFRVDPKYYLDDPKITIIMQYHSIPDSSLGEKWRNPVANLFLKNGELQYDFRASREKVTPSKNGKFLYSHVGTLKLGAPRWNEWNDIQVHQVFDMSGHGLVEVSLNGRQVSANNTSVGFNDEKGPYLKFGIYAPGSSIYDKKIIDIKNIEIR